MNTNQHKLEQVKAYISKDKIKAAITLLLEIASDNDDINAIIIQSAKKHRIEKEVLFGTISFEEKSVEMDTIISSLLYVVNEIEEGFPKESVEAAKPNMISHTLHDFPTFPMVKGHLVSDKILKECAAIIPPNQARMYVEMANAKRKEADPNDTEVTLIQFYNLPPPETNDPLHFWFNVFTQARLHGPRMLAALLFILPTQMFTQEAKDAVGNLLSQLKNYKK